MGLILYQNCAIISNLVVILIHVLIPGKDEKENSEGLQCIFNSIVGNLTVTDGTHIGLRKDLNGIYLLKTILQAPLQDTRDEEIVVEMTLPDVSCQWSLPIKQ